MDNRTDNNVTPEQAQTLGRRDLLKALAATGGAVTAAALLPGKWSKPVIEAGVMPAHAQTSGVLSIDLLNVVLSRNLRSTDVDDQGVAPSFEATFNYNDEACQVDGDTLLYATASSGLGSDILFDGVSLSDVPATYGGPCDGEIGFNFTSVAGYYNGSLTVKINAGGRYSNPDTDLIPFPVINTVP